VTRRSVDRAAVAGEGRGLDVQPRPALRLLRRDGRLLHGEVTHLAVLQGLTFVHFSAQHEPCLTHKNTLHTLNTP
jgi:hypothetical protein